MACNHDMAANLFDEVQMVAVRKKNSTHVMAYVGVVV
jgi:hypothetical protein